MRIILNWLRIRISLQSQTQINTNANTNANARNYQCKLTRTIRDTNARKLSRFDLTMPRLGCAQQCTARDSEHKGRTLCQSNKRSQFAHALAIRHQSGLYIWSTRDTPLSPVRVTLSNVHVISRVSL